MHHPKLEELVRRDPRYAYEAYEFVFAALNHTLQMLERNPPEPLVLSRPQFLAAQLVVIAEVKSVEEPVKVVEVLFPANGAEIQTGDLLKVVNLADCRAARFEAPDFSGPGLYLLPLRRAGMK